MKTSFLLLALLSLTVVLMPLVARAAFVADYDLDSTTADEISDSDYSLDGEQWRELYEEAPFEDYTADDGVAWSDEYSEDDLSDFVSRELPGDSTGGWGPPVDPNAPKPPAPKQTLGQRASYCAGVVVGGICKAATLGTEKPKEAVYDGLFDATKNLQNGGAVQKTNAMFMAGVSKGIGKPKSAVKAINQ